MPCRDGKEYDDVSYERFVSYLRSKAGAAGRTPPIPFEKIQADLNIGDMVTMSFLNRTESSENTRAGYVFIFET
jgi:hypothetical protein